MAPILAKVVVSGATPWAAVAVTTRATREIEKAAVPEQVVAETVTVAWLELIWAMVALMAQATVRKVVVSGATPLVAVTEPTPATREASEATMLEELAAEQALVRKVVVSGATPLVAVTEPTPAIRKAVEATMLGQLAAEEALAESWPQCDLPRQCTFSGRAKSAEAGQPHYSVRR